MIEWDIASYQRKFSDTICKFSIGGEPADWRYVRVVDEGGLVYTQAKYPVGRVVPEVAKEEMSDEFEGPEVTFSYERFPCGIYHSDGRLHFIYGRHNYPTYKIGLNQQRYQTFTYNTLKRTFSNYFSVMIHPKDAIKEVTEVDEKLTIYNHRLYRYEDELFYLNHRIALLGETVCMLKNKSFTPLVKQYLEPKWQIVN
jgi:hypothetical protein